MQEEYAQVAASDHDLIDKNMKYIKLVLNKKFKTEQPKLSWLNYFFPPNSDDLYKYHRALDKFIYDFGGCITGWERKVDLSNHNMLSFSCIFSHPEAENDLPYLYKWIEKIKDSYNLCIYDNIETSGEMIINVE